ncbi:unnamed protein product, partial [Ilex paraguariensis]
TRLLHLHIQLQTLPKGDLPIATYLQSSKHIVDELTIVEKRVDINEFNAIIFLSDMVTTVTWLLLSTMSDMVTAISARIHLVSHPELHNLLVSHEIQLQEREAYSTILGYSNIAY